MRCTLRSLYLCVQDMDRALAFYEALLARPPVVRDEIYSVFDIDGFRMGLFAYQKVGEAHQFGSNCLPSLQVESLSELKALISPLKVCFPLTQIGPNWVAEFVDSEGNHIEITTAVR